MIITETEFEKLLIIEPKIHSDKRGYFTESYKKLELDTMLDHKFNCIQENESKSNYGVIRGLHFQKGKHAQAKLVRVLQGKVLDVVLDLRENSKTFGKHFSILLSENNKKQLFIPRGFAHGFVTLENDTIFSYKIDNEYCPESESGIYALDNDLNIDWIVEDKFLFLSEKDKSQVKFRDYIND